MPAAVRASVEVTRGFSEEWGKGVKHFSVYTASSEN